MSLYTTLFVSILLVPVCWGQQARHGSAAGGWRVMALPVKTQPVTTALAIRKTGDSRVERSSIGTADYHSRDSWRSFDSYDCDGRQPARPQVIADSLNLWIPAE